MEIFYPTYSPKNLLNFYSSTKTSKRQTKY
jgi:hypothetical protein